MAKKNTNENKVQDAAVADEGSALVRTEGNEPTPATPAEPVDADSKGEFVQVAEDLN